MIIAILSGGPEQYLPNFNDPLLQDVKWIGVDRGTITLIEQGIQPIRAFGDFDSISSTELERIRQAQIPLSTFSPEKDATDLELALSWVLDQAPETCYVLGGTGGRLDHAMMNVQLLLLGETSFTTIYLMDQQNIVTLLKPGSYTIVKRPEFHYISFIALTPQVHGLSLMGFKYPLEDHLLKWGSSLCISNEFESEKGTVNFREGLLLLVHSRDEVA